ncbi:hypothetical protein AVEN_3534-1 [Araneus ventricosus]|uniref:Uncharacterized protein n=1 Tax=Araneus ventricosus TaxID=182803 RepID=A0A4Y2VFC4_ARAVE|nr:hypothetical protein AVEN_3534-1 [Araneus ventricosus]
MQPPLRETNDVIPWRPSMQPRHGWKDVIPAHAYRCGPVRRRNDVIPVGPIDAATSERKTSYPRRHIDADATRRKMALPAKAHRHRCGRHETEDASYPRRHIDADTSRDGRDVVPAHAYRYGPVRRRNDVIPAGGPSMQRHGRKTSYPRAHRCGHF